ncbi:hypothetical protein FD754_013157, partial [Muntiacus muntjak]
EERIYVLGPQSSTKKLHKTTHCPLQSLVISLKMQLGEADRATPKLLWSFGASLIAQKCLFWGLAILPGGSDGKESACNVGDLGAFPPSALYARKDLLQRSTHIATKTFQAFRIFVNNELNELYTGLETAQKFLRPGGHLVALSFHSLEDRIIKRFLLGISMTERFNLSARQKVIQKSQLDSDQENKKHISIGKAPLMWKLMHKKVLTPEDQDVQDNPRGRSAKLRAAIKL